MSDSSSKSEGYSRILSDAAVPSTPLCCFIIFIILKSYSDITGIYGTIFNFIFFILFVLSLIHTAFKYKNIIDNRKILFLSIIIPAILCSAILFFLTNKITLLTKDSGLPEYMENISIVVDSVTFKRYSSDINFHTTGLVFPDTKGIINYHGDNVYSKGDHLFIHKKIMKVATDDKISYNSYLIARGIHFRSDLSDDDITILKKSETDFRINLQKHLLARIDSIFKPPTSGLIKALLTGNQNYIEKKIILQFRDSGVLHCLSASGMHVAIFAALPAFLLIPFFRKNIAMLASLSVVLFYLFITDMPVSLIRAVVMFGLFYLQMILYRKKNIFNYLMLTCSMVLLISPWEIFSPGFQLSFAATAGILIFYKQYRNSLKNLPELFADTTAVTLSAQIITLPVILFHMNQLNTSGLFSNIIIIPLITLIMGAALFAIIISFISLPAALFSGTITGLIFKLTLLITNMISGLRLNFYVYDITIPLCIIILISTIPLIRFKETERLKFYPVLISILLCTLYLKKYYQLNENSFTIAEGNSKAEVRITDNKQILKLNLEDGSNIDSFISQIKIKNPDIKIIELSNNSTSGLIASRRIMNEYIIDEFRFNGIPDLNNTLKKIIFQLESDNVIVKFTKVSLPD